MPPLRMGQVEDGAALGTKSWKVEIKTEKDADWVGNEFRYPNRDIAMEQGSELYGRWIAVKSWRVTMTPDAPTTH